MEPTVEGRARGLVGINAINVYHAVAHVSALAFHSLCFGADLISVFRRGFLAAYRISIATGGLPRRGRESKQRAVHKSNYF